MSSLPKQIVAETKAEQRTKQMQDTIERQAQAIRCLEAEKTRGTLGPQHEPRMGVGILVEMRRNSNVIDYSQENMHEALNIKLDNAGDWKQF